jgi:hypothetical protein
MQRCVPAVVSFAEVVARNFVGVPVEMLTPAPQMTVLRMNRTTSLKISIQQSLETSLPPDLSS